MPNSNDIKSNFGNQWGLLLTIHYGLGLALLLVLYRLGLPFGFLSYYYTV